VTNDSQAFTTLSAGVAAMGGGTIVLGKGKTYRVGRQLTGGPRAFTPQPLLEFTGLTRPLTILGNGARLRAATGLRFGSFDPVTGRPVQHSLPNFDASVIASPYWAMIVVRASSAPVTICDIELDGNVANLRLGGPWGDAGRQVPGSGLYLADNALEEIIDNVFSHHHPLDGAMISGQSGRIGRSSFTRLVCHFNGRQGLSFVGGRGYDFYDCEFAHSGRAGVTSPPGAGVDIEAEDTVIRDLTFKHCRFVDNVGCGLVADAGDSRGVRLSDCQFVGTTAWSAWPAKPGFHFERCTFAGAMVHAHASRDPALATHFIDCRFTDEPRLSPTREVYFSSRAGGPIADLGASDNVLFDRCRFDLAHRGVLPWSWRAIYRDCVMNQASLTPAMTKGKYLGRTAIQGPVDLYGSMIVGTVVLNGKVVPRGPVGTGVKPW
jgi:hypothetical protein